VSVGNAHAGDRGRLGRIQQMRLENIALSGRMLKLADWIVQHVCRLCGLSTLMWSRLESRGEALSPLECTRTRPWRISEPYLPPGGAQTDLSMHELIPSPATSYRV